MMGIKKDYAAFSSIFQEILDEPDIKLALDILKDQITPIKKSKQITEEDKHLLLEIKLPSIKADLEDKLAKQEKKKKKKKSNPNNNAVDIDDEDLRYYQDLNNDNDFDEDDSGEQQTWQDINPDSLDYPTWLHKIGLREFFPLPNESLFKLCACITLVNSAAIPTRTPSFTTEGELPLIYCFGDPGTGKGTFADFIGNHYLFSQDSSISAYQTVGDQTTLSFLRETFDLACNLGDGILREGCVHVNDFVPELILKGGKWSQSHAPFIAVKRSESIARVSKNGRRSQDVQGEFYMWCLKILSSNNPPTTLINTLQGKFDRRIISIPITKRGSGLNRFNWGNVREEYQCVWKGNVGVYRKKYLRPILKKDDIDFATIPVERVNQSRVLISVGLFTGIFETFEEACQHFADYWEYIADQYTLNQDDLFISALEGYVTEQENKRMAIQSRKSYVGQNARLIEFDLDALHILATQGGNKEKERAKLMQWMRIRGYEMFRQMRGGRFCFYFSKNLGE